MENTYCFIFGKTPQLSLAEIMAVLGSGIKLLLVTEDAAIVSCPQPLAVAKLQDQLGGTIKIGLIFGTTTDLAEINWSKWWQPTAGRFQFGFSAYGLSRSEQVKVKNVGLRLKKTWVSQGSPCRLVVGKEAALSSVIVIKEKLLNPGADFLIISDPNKKCWWLGQTQACQKFAEYAEAEFGRPQ
ncbi:MAG: hypothetical protein NTV81_03060, partial [Candidatus Komeilibacteria bacterium]|nr:hypothetical protein [Candidatus Komeilibacteria bacterium]